MSASIEFNVTYLEDDFVRGMMHARHHVGWTWVNIVSSTASAITGFGLVYWFAFREPGPVNSKDGILAAIALLISYPFAIGLDKFKPSAESHFSKLFRENPVFREAFTVRINTQGVDSRSASFESLVRWDAFVKAFESDDDFFFFLSESQPLFFPKRALLPDQMLTLRRIASKHMDAKAKFLR